jgi:hypothetical protein
LRFADKGQEDGGIEGKSAVEAFGIGLGVAVVDEMIFDGFFELDFAVIDHASLFTSSQGTYFGCFDLLRRIALSILSCSRSEMYRGRVLSLRADITAGST